MFICVCACVCVRVCVLVCVRVSIASSYAVIATVGGHCCYRPNFVDAELEREGAVRADADVWHRCKVSAITTSHRNVQPHVSTKWQRQLLLPNLRGH